MVKTLRITSILVVVLAAGLFVFPAVFGFRGDNGIEDFLRLPSVVKEFRKAESGKEKTSEGQVSPLVAQAEAFGKYLNPPKPRKPRRVVKKPGQKPIVPEVTVREPLLTPKFKVIATSFYATQPELSLALIDEPGKGRHWVREGSEVTHLTVEHIRDGVVVVKGAKGTFEHVVEARPPQRSLLADYSPVSSGQSDRISSKLTPVPALGSGETESVVGPGTSSAAGGSKQVDSEDQAALAEQILKQLLAMSANQRDEADKTGSGTSDEKSTAAETSVSDVQSMRISGKEAKKLGNLGQELTIGQQDPNRAKSRKTEASKEGWKPKKSTRSRPTSSTSKRRTTTKKR